MTFPGEAVGERETDGPLVGFPVRSMVAQISLRGGVRCRSLDSRLFAHAVNGGYRHGVGADASICAVYRKVERPGSRSRQFTDHCLVSPYYVIQRLMPKLIIEPIIEMMRNAVSGEQMKMMVLEGARLDHYSVALAFHGLELEVVVVEIVIDGSLNDFSE